MDSLAQAAAATAEDFSDLDAEIRRSSTDEIRSRTRLIDNEIRHNMTIKIKDNTEKININKQRHGDEEEDGANVDLDAQRRGKCAVIKATTRQTVFLPVIGLVPRYRWAGQAGGGAGRGDCAANDPCRPVQEVGIKPPKGVLMYGPPGTGKTLLARACAAQTQSTYLKLAGPQLVQMFIGDGAKMVRDAFALAKEKAPTIIFIDELDAIGTKRFDSEKSGDREVQRTMLELLNQLDGFGSDDRIKVIAATNRIDILDPALLRSGRLDRKIEFPLPNEDARARIIQIHSRKMNVSSDVNFDELARSCDEFNGAQCKAICVEAGMIALRRGGTKLSHEDFMEGIQEVQAKKKTSLQYFA
ncbi:AAA-domain-containing protein [Linderina pennispora]|uniref:26S proteasome regulatory subunit 6B homolog n=1 Tax=Linderina pennispora TaxID=61395 RepID=A0A1Y1VQN2_9FUNG|nr:AAA-domain-containing protein [Linderina pennispora]ORX63602.1 AAA-domain-containing protein [Linderina pennispora]